MGIRSQLARLLTATAVLTGLLHGVSYAENASSLSVNLTARGILPSTEKQIVDEFVKRVHGNWRVNVDANDYDVVRGSDYLLIVPKGSATPRRLRAGGFDLFELSGSVSRPSGVKATADGAEWGRPQCMSRVNMYNPIDPSVVEAWADACWQGGTISYPGQTGWDAVLKQWQTCATTGNGFNYKLRGCSMAFAPVDGGGISFLDWNDWDPKSTIIQNPCANVNFVVNVAGIGAELGMNLCETLNPIKGEKPLDFQANWSGYAAIGHSRQTGDIISVHNTLHDDIRFNVRYGGMSIGP